MRKRKKIERVFQKRENFKSPRVEFHRGFYIRPERTKAWKESIYDAGCVSSGFMSLENWANKNNRRQILLKLANV